MQAENKTPISPPAAKSSKMYDPRHGQIKEGLATLVSVAAAQYWDDSCRIKETDPSFKTETLLVGHLLREIESSLRDVLRPLILSHDNLCDQCGKELPAKQCACGRPTELTLHSAEIKAIVAALDIGSQDNVESAWLHFADQSHRYAHRRNLEKPRPSSDPDFHVHWSEAELIFSRVLDKFSTKYAEVIVRLDRLIASPRPTKGLVNRLKNEFPNSPKIRGYFFKKIQDPQWLPCLKAAGLFAELPAVVYYDDGGFSHPHWLITDYLVRIAPGNSAAVRDILLGLPGTDNEEVKNDLVQVTLALTDDDQIKLSEKLNTWI